MKELMFEILAIVLLFSVVFSFADKVYGRSVSVTPTEINSGRFAHQLTR